MVQNQSGQRSLAATLNKAAARKSKKMEGRFGVTYAEVAVVAAPDTSSYGSWRGPAGVGLKKKPNVIPSVRGKTGYVLIDVNGEVVARGSALTPLQLKDFTPILPGASLKGAVKRFFEGTVKRAAPTRENKVKSTQAASTTPRLTNFIELSADEMRKLIDETTPELMKKSAERAMERFDKKWGLDSKSPTVDQLTGETIEPLK